MSLKVEIVTPAPQGTTLGNRITAQRYARLLRDLGLGAKVVESWSGAPCDLLIALHGKKSAASIRRFAGTYPRTPLVVVLTGTDVYDSAGPGPEVANSLALATLVVVLQSSAVDALTPAVRAKARVILQSSERSSGEARALEGVFEVVALAHLRGVKDPFLPAEAVRGLPDASRLRISHVGAALDRGMERRAREESARNPRWRWLGERSHKAALHVLARAQGFVQTSLSEGGSSALSEALLAGKPILATRIPGSVGMLGADHPGLFEAGDAAALGGLLERLERDAVWREELAQRSRRLAPSFVIDAEREAWRALLAEVGLARGRPRIRLARVGRIVEPPEFPSRLGEGLTGTPKVLPERIVEESAVRGAFDPTSEPLASGLARAELALLARHARDLVRRCVRGTSLVEIGAGNARATRHLVTAVVERDARARLALLDVSTEALERSAQELVDECASLDVRAFVCAPLANSSAITPEGSGPKLWTWLGARVGNLDRAEAERVLAEIASRLEIEDRLAIVFPRRGLGPRLQDETDRALRAGLRRLHSIDLHLDPAAFESRFAGAATFDPVQGRVDLFLESAAIQDLEIPALASPVSLARGERIHVGAAWLYEEVEIRDVLERAGVGVLDVFTDEDALVSLVLAAPRT